MKCVASRSYQAKLRTPCCETMPVRLGGGLKSSCRCSENTAHTMKDWAIKNCKRRRSAAIQDAQKKLLLRSSQFVNHCPATDGDVLGGSRMRAKYVFLWWAIAKRFFSFSHLFLSTNFLVITSTVRREKRRWMGPALGTHRGRSCGKNRSKTDLKYVRKYMLKA